MTPRTRYTLKLALRVKLGAWFTDEELDAFMEYLGSQGIRMETETWQRCELTPEKN